MVFQEPDSLPFDVTSVRSQFQHVFIIVRVQDPNTDNTSYRLVLDSTRSKLLLFVRYNWRLALFEICKSLVLLFI